MKKIIIFTLLCLLLNSCFSYKNIDLDKEEFNLNTIFRITKTDNEKKKGKLHSLNDSLIVLERKPGEKHTVFKGNIQQIQKRKFSLAKTIALPVGITAVVIAVTVSALANWSISLDGY